MARAKRLVGAGVVALLGWGFFTVGGAGLAAEPPTGFFDHLDLGWMQNPYWFDGKAEVNLYHTSVVIYGTPREGEDVSQIVVTERHRGDQLVKADDWQKPGLVDMLKFNDVWSVRTGIYRYEQMLSFFFPQQSLRLAKMTLSSHEWCGNTFKELVNYQDRSSYQFNTYWDGQGNGSFEVSFPEDLVVYDSLPVQLRALRFTPGLATELHLLPRQRSSKASRPEWHTASLRVRDKVELAVPAGSFEAWEVSLEHQGGTDRLWLEVAFPNRMLRWETATGDRLELRKALKVAYWQLNQPGGEKYLE